MIFDCSRCIFGPKWWIYGWSKIVIFDHIFPVLARMTLKLSANDGSDDLNRLRMPSHDFGSFKKCSEPKWWIYWWSKTQYLPYYSRICSYVLETFMMIYEGCVVYISSSGSTEVEILEARLKLQFSTSVEPTAQKIIIIIIVVVLTLRSQKRL